MADDGRSIEGEEEEEEEETTMEEEVIAAVEQLIHGCEQHVKENCDQVMLDLDSVKNETLKKVEATECEIIKQCSEKVNAAKESISGETMQKLKEMECGILRMCNEKMDVAIDQIKKDTGKKMLDLEGFIMKRCNDRMDHILTKMREEVVLGFEKKCRQIIEIVRLAGNHIYGEVDDNETSDMNVESAAIGITHDTMDISDDTPAPQDSEVEDTVSPEKCESTFTAVKTHVNPVVVLPKLEGEFQPCVIFKDRPTKVHKELEDIPEPLRNTLTPFIKQSVYATSDKLSGIQKAYFVRYRTTISKDPSTTQSLNDRAKELYAKGVEDGIWDGSSNPSIGDSLSFVKYLKQRLKNEFARAKLSRLCSTQADRLHNK